MTVPIQQESTTRSYIRSINRRQKIANFWFLLIFFLLCISSTGHSTTKVAQPRKVRVFHPVTAHATTIAAAAAPSLNLSRRSSSSSSSRERKRNNQTNGANKLYEEDKRLVHTGPNPLHN
ncbi:hypothetical protein A4A49_14025 [Nicotiana attenuata]|uniref:Uncharacterized protein n=1 Tax=Nicotiana attenuata TaxID=49451 RepID=A0A1J6JIR5_NICAT|nr:hypothetical protein A4A49_14025 [Nicotiana attenuata]